MWSRNGPYISTLHKRVLRVLNVCIMNKQHGPVQLEVIDHGSGAHRRHPAPCELQNGRMSEGVSVRRTASTQTSGTLSAPTCLGGVKPIGSRQAGLSALASTKGDGASG